MKRKKASKMTTTPIKKLNLKALQHRNGSNISSKEALKDIIPFSWENEIIDGKTKIIIDKADNKNV